MANVCQEQSCNEKIREGHYLCFKHWRENQEGVIDECFDCGAYKNVSQKTCLSCRRKESEIATSEAKVCREQFCGKYVRQRFDLCLEHWQEERDRVISECPQCGVYKNASFDLCLDCFRKGKEQSARGKEISDPTENRQETNGGDQVKIDTFAERIAMLEEDRKAQDKRLLFDYQQQKCVYCGTEFGYDKLEIEHMIPKMRGGQDNVRNYQLTCQSCNQAKGTMTDIEFRKRHAKHLPQTERTPANPPINPRVLRESAQGRSFRQSPRI